LYERIVGAAKGILELQVIWRVGEHEVHTLIGQACQHLKVIPANYLVNG
jgi:hypothetical protein